MRWPRAVTRAGHAESVVTAALCAVDGTVGHALANFILESAGMVKPGQYAAGRRSPAIGVRGGVCGRLLAAAECKRDAHISK